MADEPPQLTRQSSLREGYPVFSRLSGTQTGNAPGHGDGGPGAKVHGKIFGIAEFQDGKHLPIRFECGLSTGSQRTALSVQSFQGGASQQDQPCRCYRKARFYSRGSSTIDRNPAGGMARHDTRLPLYGRPAFGRHRYPPMEAN